MVVKKKDLYWQEAIDAWIDYWKRNQWTAEKIFNAWQDFNEKSFMNASWVSGKFDDYQVSKDDWANTISDVKDRYNKLKTPDQTEIKLDSQTEMETWATKEMPIEWPEQIPMNGWLSWAIKTPDTLKNKNLLARDEEMKRIQDEKNLAIDSKIDSWNLEKAEYEKRKGYYKNFDAESWKYDQIVDSVRNQIKATWQDLTEEQYQTIANNLWVDINDVKDPRNILNQLEFTEEWERKFWIDKDEAWIEGLERDYNRRKEDLAFQLEWQKTNLENQLEDVRLQLERNIDWMETSWAWAWALKSSWYQQGIKNVRSDWEKTISRLQDMLERVESADETNVKRLTEDFKRANEEAKLQLDEQMKSIKIDSWMQLNWLAEEYGISSEWLTKQLDAISKEYGLKTVDVLDSYYKNMREVDNIINSNIDRQEKLNKMQDDKANKRYDQLLENDWVLLLNTNINEIVNEVKSWAISREKGIQLQKIMMSSITSTLNGMWRVTTEDLKSIQGLMKKWYTPAEIVASFWWSSRFQETEDDKTSQDWTKLDDDTLLNKRTWETKKVWDFESWEIMDIVPFTWDFEEKMDVVRTWTNVAKDTENPWNITADSVPAWYTKESYGKMIWANWTYLSPNWREYFVFPDTKSWVLALAKDIKAKQTWRTQTWLNANSSLLDLVWVYTWSWASYVNAVASKLWVDKDTKIWQINTNNLANAISVAEWFWDISAQLKPTKLTPEQKFEAKAIVKDTLWTIAARNKETVELVEKMMSKWQTKDDIQDALRKSWLWVEFTWAHKEAFNNITQKWYTKDERGRAQEQLEDSIEEYGVWSNQVKEKLINLAWWRLAAADASSLIWRYNLVANLEDIKWDLKAYEDMWWDTNIFSWKVEALYKMAWTIKDPDKRKIAQKIAMAIQNYRKSISWAAFTEAESKEYVDIFPSIDNVWELNSTLFDAVLETTNVTLDNTLWYLMGPTSYNEIFKWWKEEQEEVQTSKMKTSQWDWGSIKEYPDWKYIYYDKPNNKYYLQDIWKEHFEIWWKPLTQEDALFYEGTPTQNTTTDDIIDTDEDLFN